MDTGVGTAEGRTGDSGSGGGSSGSGGRNAGGGFCKPQRVNGVPSLLQNKNRFACLEVDSMSESEAEDEGNCLATPAKSRTQQLPKRKKWERRLPKEYKVATTGSQSLRVHVQLQTMDTAEVHGAEGLVDCGADGQFLDVDFVEQNKITTHKLTRPIRVKNVDGSPNENGPVTEVADLMLRYNGHAERVMFAVTRLGKEKLILGLPWLKEHNPEINWVTEEVKMSRCPEKCSLC